MHLRQLAPELLLGAILLIASLLRLPALSSVPAGFFCDAGAQMEGVRLFDEDKKRWGMPPFPAERVAWLEQALDKAAEELPPLKEFVLPGGELAAGHLHIARCVCRRAERLCVALARTEPVSPQVIPYLNRLSDCLFQLARLVNLRAGRGDVLWKKEYKRG